MAQHCRVCVAQPATENDRLRYLGGVERGISNFKKLASTNVPTDRHGGLWVQLNLVVPGGMHACTHLHLA
jgi:hypothetical protein